MREFIFYPQDATPRGIRQSAPFEGQHLLVMIAAQNTGAVGIEFKMPDGGVFGDGAVNGVSFRMLRNGEIPLDWER